MGFYIRKSVKAGPFRFNLSKSGIGVSMGVRGLRVGTGPRGHYVHAGAGGFYYRSSIGARPTRSFADPEGIPPPSMPAAPSNVDMIEIDSGNVLEMNDARFQDLLDDINAKSEMVRMSTLLGGMAAVAAMLVAVQIPALAVLGFAGAVVAWGVGRWIDSSRRSVVILYDFEQSVATAYEAVVRAFEQVAACQRLWHIPAGGEVRDVATWKRNAGATTILDRKAIALRMGLPPVVKSNIDVPCLPVGQQLLYFFPDKLLVSDGSKVGAVGYDRLRVRVQDSNFIESEAIPADTKILRYTWQHPNKQGGPDRRFRDNRQIPVCAYEAIHFGSDNGVNELIKTSARGRGGALVHALERLGRLANEVLPPAPGRLDAR
jgi:hypothetical protein